jgi:hypothetical protein
VVDQLDEDRLAAEQADEPVERRCGRIRTSGGERLPHGALAASGEHRPVAAAAIGEVVEVVPGTPFSPPASWACVIAAARR